MVNIGILYDFGTLFNKSAHILFVLYIGVVTCGIREVFTALKQVTEGVKTKYWHVFKLLIRGRGGAKPIWIFRDFVLY